MQGRALLMKPARPAKNRFKVSHSFVRSRPGFSFGLTDFIGKIFWNDPCDIFFKSGDMSRSRANSNRTR
jgi:hypothetical protein